MTGAFDAITRVGIGIFLCSNYDAFGNIYVLINSGSDLPALDQVTANPNRDSSLPEEILETTVGATESALLSASILE